MRLTPRGRLVRDALFCGIVAGAFVLVCVLFTLIGAQR